MPIFTSRDFDQHEQVVCFYNAKLDIKAIVAIHNTALGPALGGCRLYPYENEQEAMDDVLRLSRGMTYKAAMANLPLGGGKMVVLGDPKTVKNKAFLEAIGTFVNSFQGKYITAEDMGMGIKDIGIMQETTPYVVGLPNGHGDPSPITAYGVYQSMLATVRYKLGVQNLQGLKIILQGLGNVGYNLAKFLHEEGAHLLAYDPNPEAMARAVQEFNVTPLKAEAVMTTPADVYAPCARGGILNKETIAGLQVPIVCGGANNQLAQEEDGDLLRARNILYAPDYITNQGGLVCVWYEKQGQPLSFAYEHINRVHDTLTEVFQLAERQKISTNRASNEIAESRFRRA